MKVGTENRTKVILAVALCLVLVVVIAVEFGGWFGNASSAAGPVTTASTDFGKEPIPAPRNPARARNAVAGKQNAARNLDPTLKLDLLKTSEDTKYEGTGRNIFKVFVEIPKIVKSPVKQPEPQVAQGPPQPPPPPPIQLTFYGFATPQGGVKRVFLAQGEDVFIAKEGDIVDRRYKVVRISPNAVEILDVLSNNRQSIPLTQG